MSSCLRSVFTLGAHQKAVIGDTKTSVIGEDHLGWLRCDGRALPVNNFYLLFRVIGYSFGGSGATFNLPYGPGTVLGIAGSGTDMNTSTFTFTLGQQVGEYVHTLTIPEIPIHNHGVANAVQDASNNITSLEYTGLTVNVSTTGVYDSGHNHGYNRSNDNNHHNDGLGITSSDNNSGTYGTNTDNASANIVDPGHRHDVTDPRHAHRLNPAGGGQYHNNVQPTLPIGNLFIYGGRVNFGTFPYTAGTFVL